MRKKHAAPIKPRRGNKKTVNNSTLCALVAARPGIETTTM